MNEAKKKGLWHNIWAKRRRGERPARRGEKGYPKTLKIGEAALRSIIRQELIQEWGLFQAMMSGNFIKNMIAVLTDMFGPTTTERLDRAGDSKVIADYQTFLGTLHMTPEYRTAWENYKQAQRRHASMDSSLDLARDPSSPAGRAFSKLRDRVMAKFDELMNTLSPENRDIWEEDVEQQRHAFVKIFSDWEKGKITTGRVLGMLDPQGIVESRRRGKPLSEAGEMFYGKDLEQLQATELLAALETAEMDLEDAGCPEDSEAQAAAFEATEMLDAARSRPNFRIESVVPIVNDLISIIRRCPDIDKYVAQRVANDLEIALARSQEVDRY